jgi:hypothetical protein
MWRKIIKGEVYTSPERARGFQKGKGNGNDKCNPKTGVVYRNSIGLDPGKHA